MNQDRRSARTAPRNLLRLLAWLLSFLVGQGLLEAQVGVSDLLPERPPGSVREFYELYGIGDAEWSGFRDGRVFTDDERSIVLNLLYRLPRLSRSDLDRWAAAAETLATLRSAPAAQRGRAWSLAGTVVSVQQVSVPEGKRVGLGFDSYFRVVMQHESQPGRCVILSRAIPAAWQAAPSGNYSATASAVFLKLAPSDGGDIPVFVARRVRWFPQSVEEDSTRLDPDLVFLAGNGMDIGLLDDVRSRNRKPMGREDRACFYELLAAVAKADPKSFRGQAEQAMDLGRLLQEPQSQHGRLMTVRGTLRRATKILIAEADGRERLAGMTAYYQLDLFVPLEDLVIRFADGEGDGDQPTFANSYPVTICVPALPVGVEEGTGLRHEVIVHAAFFKVWAYRSTYMKSFDASQLQLSPMLIGQQPSSVAPATPASPWISLWAGGGFLLVLAGIWIWLWRVGRRDARFRTGVLRKGTDHGPEPP